MTVPWMIRGMKITSVLIMAVSLVILLAGISAGLIVAAGKIPLKHHISASLSALIEAWNTLDGDAREAVLAIINAMKRG